MAMRTAGRVRPVRMMLTERPSGWCEYADIIQAIVPGGGSEGSEIVDLE